MQSDELQDEYNATHPRRKWYRLLALVRNSRVSILDNPPHWHCQTSFYTFPLTWTWGSISNSSKPKKGYRKMGILGGNDLDSWNWYPGLPITLALPYQFFTHLLWHGHQKRKKRYRVQNKGLHNDEQHSHPGFHTPFLRFQRIAIVRLLRLETRKLRQEHVVILRSCQPSCVFVLDHFTFGGSKP